MHFKFGKLNSFRTDHITIIKLSVLFQMFNVELNFCAVLVWVQVKKYGTHKFAAYRCALRNVSWRHLWWWSVNTSYIKVREFCAATLTSLKSFRLLNSHHTEKENKPNRLKRVNFSDLIDVMWMVKMASSVFWLRIQRAGPFWVVYKNSNSGQQGMAKLDKCELVGNPLLATH